MRCVMNTKSELLLLVTIILAGCQDRALTTQSDAITVSAQVDESQGNADSRLVVFANEQVPSDFQERIERLGGSVRASFDNIGIGVVSGLTDASAALLAQDGDVRAVEPDMSYQLAALDDPADGEALPAPADAIGLTTSSSLPQQAALYPRQWNLRAVGADRAWNAGYLGSPDVTVVILDTGIDYLHPEVQGLVDLQRSRSFMPREDTLVQRLYPGRHPVTDLFYHGTAQGATVASNAVQLAGMTRRVTLVGVKVGDRLGRTNVSTVIAGFVYSAEIGADVISLAGSVGFEKKTQPGLIAAFNRAVNYASRKGALIVTVAGNDTLDLDHRIDRVRLPCEAPHAICMSATGPTFAETINGPWNDVDQPAL